LYRVFELTLLPNRQKRRINKEIEQKHRGRVRAGARKKSHIFFVVSSNGFFTSPWYETPKNTIKKNQGVFKGGGIEIEMQMLRQMRTSHIAFVIFVLERPLH
jgi:hypothetical protein